MADFSSLKSQILGKVILPSDHGYSFEIKKVWNALLRDKKPLAFVKVKGKDDVVKTVKFCVENKLEICVSAGATTDFAIDDDAVVVDLSQMKEVLVDKESKTARVDCGATICDVDRVLYNHGFAIPLGSYSPIGVAGITLVGGIGFLTSSYGCTSDNVVEFELVTAAGDVVKASEEENPDLFWGLKGCGSNFGIVISMVFNLHDMPQWIVGGCLHYPMSRAEEVFKAVRDFHDKRADSRLCIYMLTHLQPTGPEIIMRLLFNGPLTEGGELVQDLNDITHPFKNDVGPVHYPNFQTAGDWLFSPGRYYCGSAGHFLKELSDEVITNLVHSMVNNVPGTNREFADTTIYMDIALGGKFNDIPAESSSFPFRNARYWVGMVGAVACPEKYDDLKNWVDTVQESNTAYGEPPYGGNAEEANSRLVALKQQYDPDNVFHRNLVPIKA